MIPLTLEKLKRDSRRLDHNIQRMKKKGRNDAASRLKFKKSLIDAQITNLIDDNVHPYHNDWSTHIVPKFH
jgi:hypothetical protein